MTGLLWIGYQSATILWGSGHPLYAIGTGIVFVTSLAMKCLLWLEREYFD